MTVTIHTGSCLTVMPSIDADSIDAIVCDPPYGLNFMGKAWDHGVPGVEFWLEAIRVAKPGAYLLAFGGTRTYHRLASAIEDAGWELRDTLMWVYGSGFPKSKNLGDGRGTALKPAWEPIIMARKPLVGTVAENAERFGTGVLHIDACRVQTSDQLKAGAGSIPCRHDVDVPRKRNGEASADRRYAASGGTNFAAAPGPRGGDPSGRWPANLIHDGSDEVVAAFPNAAGQLRAVGPEHGAKPSVNAFGDFGPRGDSGSAARFFYCAKADPADRNDGCDGLPLKTSGMVSNTSGQHMTRRDGGAPAPSANNHPTVKPTDLMRYLCRLVTPPGGVVLDPFMGSGSTGRAAVSEGFRFVGIELNPDYAEIARCRINAMQPGLSFGAIA